MRYSYKLLLEGLGARIKQLRKERGWTLEDMVVRHGYHQSHWQGFETGKRGISVPSLLRIASLFDMTLCDLLKDLGEDPQPKTVPPKSTEHPDSHTGRALSNSRLLTPARLRSKRKIISQPRPPSEQH